MCLRRFDIGERLWLLRLRYSQLRERLLEWRRWEWEREREREWCLRELRWERDLRIDIENCSLGSPLPEVKKKIPPICLCQRQPFLPWFWPGSRARSRPGMTGAIFGAYRWAAGWVCRSPRGPTPRARPRVLDRSDTEVRNTIQPSECTTRKEGQGVTARALCVPLSERVHDILEFKRFDT